MTREASRSFVIRRGCRIIINRSFPMNSRATRPRVVVFVVVRTFVATMTTTTTTTRRSSAHAYRFALVGGLSFGYDLALVGGILRAMRDALGMSAGARGAVVAAVKVGAIVGAFVGAGSMRSAGRRWAAVTTTAACSLVGGGTTWAFARWTSVGGIAFGRMVDSLESRSLKQDCKDIGKECTEYVCRGEAGPVRSARE